MFSFWGLCFGYVEVPIAANLRFAVPLTWLNAFSGGLLLPPWHLGIWKSNFNFSVCICLPLFKQK